MTDYIPGIYVVRTETLSIRREPRIVEYTDPKTKKFVTNAVGKLTFGTQRAVYLIEVSDTDNSVWGRVSLYDSAGIAEWCCIKNSNREFMKFEEPLEHNPIPEVPPVERIPKVQLDRVEWKLDKILKILESK